MSESFIVLGDQLSREVEPWPSMATSTTIVMIESRSLIAQARHLTRVALYLAAMRHFAAQLVADGYTVDYRVAEDFTQAVRAHREHYAPTRMFMNAPRGRRATQLFASLGVEIVSDPFYLTDLDEMRARKKRPSTLENFYRDQRQRLNILMQGSEPVGGQWNYDTENRQPLPKDGGQWPEPWCVPLSETERGWVEELRATHHGDDALMYWPRTRDQALDQLRDAVTRIIPRFGPHEDAASRDNWHLAHSRLSPAINMGLLHPREVIDAVAAAFYAGAIPVASAEGFIRQVVGWREWVWVLHHLRDESYESSNVLGATEPLPDTWRVFDAHPMNCVDGVLSHLRHYGWNHHIERLMILANAATVAGIDPLALSEWMMGAYVDGAQWVMEANVIGMGTYGDGGQTGTKPYIAGGNYVSKMTNYCTGCQFSPTERTGPTACPLTTLYWDFLLRHEQALATVNRIAPQRRAALARPDRDEIRAQAPQAIEVIVRGRRAPQT